MGERPSRFDFCRTNESSPQATDAEIFQGKGGMRWIFDCSLDTPCTDLEIIMGLELVDPQPPRVFLAECKSRAPPSPVASCAAGREEQEVVRRGTRTRDTLDHLRPWSLPTIMTAFVRGCAHPWLRSSIIRCGDCIKLAVAERNPRQQQQQPRQQSRRR